ncbi:MAG: hypothetical protein JOY79_04435 [Acidobacteriaceae bacterium]|nr:hypothetical protein [Acidobacteriaceae bacterium]
MAQYRDSGSYSPNQYPNTQYPNSPNPNAQSYIPEGTRFIAVLDDKLETNKAKPGKKFKAHLGEDLVAPNGTVIPHGKTIRGHVSQAESGFRPMILLSFDQIETQHGWVPLAATVSGVPGEHGAKGGGAEGEIERASVNKRRAIESAAAGAAVGAVTGTVIGGPHGAIIGAAVGGAGGLGAGVLTDRNLKLNKGTQLELRLDRQLFVPAR